MIQSQEMMSAREVAKIFDVSVKTVRAHIEPIKIGRQYRYSRESVMRRMRGGGHGPSPFATISEPDYRALAREAQSGWQVNDHQVICDRKTVLLLSTVAAFLIDHPDGDVNSGEFVAYAHRNMQRDGGETGEALRADIIREAVNRGLPPYR